MESSFFPPKQRTAESPQGRANRMLKPDFPKKGMGKGEEKKKKEEMERKKKKKMKIKKRTKERKGRIPDQRSKGSEKGKEAILDQ